MSNGFVNPTAGTIGSSVGYLLGGILGDKRKRKMRQEDIEELEKEKTKAARRKMLQKILPDLEPQQQRAVLDEFGINLPPTKEESLGDVRETAARVGDPEEQRILREELQKEQERKQRLQQLRQLGIEGGSVVSGLRTGTITPDLQLQRSPESEALEAERKAGAQKDISASQLTQKKAGMLSKPASKLDSKELNNALDDTRRRIEHLEDLQSKGLTSLTGEGGLSEEQEREMKILKRRRSRLLKQQDKILGLKTPRERLENWEKEHRAGKLDTEQYKQNIQDLYIEMGGDKKAYERLVKLLNISKQ